MSFFSSSRSLLSKLFLATTFFSPFLFAQEALPDYAQRNLATIQSIYNITVYPNNAQIVNQGASAVPPGLFNQNAVGRVSPVGNFSGFDDSIEYFFALAPVPNPQQGNIVIFKAEVVNFISACPEVATSLVYLRTGKYDTKTQSIDFRHPTTTLSQVAFWRFDEEGAVLKYQAWIPNLQKWTQVGTGVDFGNLLVQKGASAAICPVVQKMCTGPNQQYSSVLDCTLSLSLKPFGNFDEAWGDNVACRTIHLLLTKVRPDVHCPHVGPHGGSPPNNYKCVDIDYSVEYFDDAELFDEPLGDTFTCGGPLLE